MPLLEADDSIAEDRRWSSVILMPDQITLGNYDKIEIVAMSESGLSTTVNATPVLPQAFGHEIHEIFFFYTGDAAGNVYLYAALDVLDLDDADGCLPIEHSLDDPALIGSFFPYFPIWIGESYSEHFPSPDSSKECMIYFDFSSLDIDLDNIGDDTVEARIRFNTGCKYAILRQASSDYANISRYYIENNALLYGYDEPVEKGDVVIMKTTDGRCSKIIITQKEVLESPDSVRILIRYDYVTFKNDTDF
jgi:hypothetical protein